MKSNSNGQIAKGNEMVSFKIRDQVLSHGSNRIDSKEYEYCKKQTKITK